MKLNKWTLGLAAVGVVSLASAARADEKQMEKVNTAIAGTTLSGDVDVAAVWRPGTDKIRIILIQIPNYAFAKNDGFYLKSIDLALDKPQDEGPWAAGYHVELMAGPDSVGEDIMATAAEVGCRCIRSGLYCIAHAGGNSAIDWKVGVWDTPIGYESSSRRIEPNYTAPTAAALNLPPARVFWAHTRSTT